MTAFHQHEFTHRDLHPDSPPSSPRAGPSTFPGSLSMPPLLPDPIPIDPALISPKRRRDPASDPDMFTPTKRMRLLGVGLAGTSSGGFLVSKAKASALQISKIPAPVLERIPDQIVAPDWRVLDRQSSLENLPRSALEERCKALELQLQRSKHLNSAREAISVGQNAQLIVQNMTMNKLQKSLYEKEKGKKKDRILMFPGGKGRHLTADEVIEQKLALDQAKETEEAEKVAKKTRKEAKKVERAEIEEKWKEMLVVHAAAVEAWEWECVRLREAGTRAKDLPKKPRRPLKPKPRQRRM
ncbi:hypothetical protein R3P38DRAFT_3609164 [Favolaschia claudopus]|uniref:Uncharacterized protein n=2 Tax=Favolaschia claudopus TaxID=2862362 RepID=A0AAW0A7E5_9AGAR